MDKKEIISKINKSEECNLVESILNNMDETSDVIKTKENIITCEINKGSVFGSSKYGYVCFTDKLDLNTTDVEQDAKSYEQIISKNRLTRLFIVSTHQISKRYSKSIEHHMTIKNTVEYWDQDHLINFTDEYFEDFWRHQDQALIAYENKFRQRINDSFQIKKLVEFRAAFEKLLEIFVEPKIKIKNIKINSQKPWSEATINGLISENKRLMVVHGEPGTGKTRVLNEIGRRLSDQNNSKSGKKYLPIFVDSISIRNSIKENRINLFSVIRDSCLDEFFPDVSDVKLLETYQMVLLIDSIDEFEDNYRKLIISSLEELMLKGVIVYLGTRSNSLDTWFEIESDELKRDAFILKFTDEQVQKFAQRYFGEKTDRAQGLINSLRENKILEKLPLTPLNLSLMSILYEGNDNHEIPSTLNDVYKNFSNLLLGRSTVASKLDFLEINIKESILNSYALAILQSPNGELKTKAEFIEFLRENFKSIEGTINIDLLPEILDYLVDHTGILTLHNGKYVKFRHDSYMEYFAANEIFNNHRELESDLVENFFDVNWQYTSIFYAGMSKKMPGFLTKITEKIGKSGTFQEYWAAAGGMGYLLQALYLTDDEKRKDGILETLKVMVKTYEGLKVFSSTIPESTPFGKFPLPVLSLFPFLIFMDNFDSATLREPLSKAFDQLVEDYETLKKNKYHYLDNIVYQLLILALTMSSDRLRMEDKIEQVIEKVSGAGSEFNIAILSLAIDNLGKADLRKQKQEILYPAKVRKSKTDEVYHTTHKLKSLMIPAVRNRFTQYDTITPDLDVKILVEGKTDALILDHAYTVLTGRYPYWEIKVGSGEEDRGGANELAKALNEGLAFLGENQIAIGIFDHDYAGIKEWKGTLYKSKFEEHPYDGYNSNIVKKRNSGNIYGILMPIPEFRIGYIQEKQTDNYFSIEHYFDDIFLDKHNIMIDTAIPGLRRPKDDKTKSKFAQKIVILEKKRELFRHFVDLFKVIDKISGMEDEVEYLV